MLWKKYISQLHLNGKKYNIRDLLSVNKSEIEKWQQEYLDFLQEWISGDETIIVKTSGSTGKPKSIKIHKDTFVISALNTANFFRFKAGDKAMLCLPGTYIAGKMMLVRSMVSGLHLYWQKPAATPEIDREYDFSAMTPMQLENILNKNKNSLNKIKKLIIGGAPVNEEILVKIDDLNTQIYETYGMTETVSHIALKRINGEDKSEYFTALENISIGIDDRSCLVLTGSNLGTGMVQTNDIIEMKDDKHFKWLGRADNVINSGGIKLIPEQIEKKLKPFIKNDFFIFGIDDNKYGQLPALAIESAKKDIVPDFSVLNKFEVPKKIFYFEKFVKTTSGKINRKDTIAMLKN